MLSLWFCFALLPAIRTRFRVSLSFPSFLVFHLFPPGDSALNSAINAKQTFFLVRVVFFDPAFNQRSSYPPLVEGIFFPFFPASSPFFDPIEPLAFTPTFGASSFLRRLLVHLAETPIHER